MRYWIPLTPTMLKLVEAAQYADWMRERVRLDLSPWPKSPEGQGLADTGLFLCHPDRQPMQAISHAP